MEYNGEYYERYQGDFFGEDGHDKLIEGLK